MGFVHFRLTFRLLHLPDARCTTYMNLLMGVGSQCRGRVPCVKAAMRNRESYRRKKVALLKACMALETTVSSYHLRGQSLAWLTSWEPKETTQQCASQTEFRKPGKDMAPERGSCPKCQDSGLGHFCLVEVSFALSCQKVQGRRL